jgi:hypothetical protein
LIRDKVTSIAGAIATVQSVDTVCTSAASGFISCSNSSHFGSSPTVKKVAPRNVAAGPIQASGEAQLHRIGDSL